MIIIISQATLTSCIKNSAFFVPCDQKFIALLSSLAAMGFTLRKFPEILFINKNTAVLKNCKVEIKDWDDVVW